MLRRIVRFLAVIALALFPVWGVQTVDAASSLAPARAPYYPSFDSTGCNAATGPFGGVTIACGTGAYLTTQITSAYGGCSEIDVSVAAWGSGPFIAVATAPVGGLTSTVTLTEAGDYFMRLSWVPTTTIGPIQIQFSAPNTGNMSLQNITVNPCPVPPTSTPVPPTNTPNPSFTPTGTATAGPSQTPTPIATYTPLPSGHNTFTRTPTAIPPTSTPGTPTATPTPGLTGACGQGFYRCKFEGVTPAGGAVAGAPWSFIVSHGLSFQDWPNNSPISASCAGEDSGPDAALICGAGYVQFQPLPADGQFCVSSIEIHSYSGSGNVYLGWALGNASVWTDANHVQNVVNTSAIICSSIQPSGTLLGLIFGVDHNSEAAFRGIAVNFNAAGAGTPVPGGTSSPTATGTATSTSVPGTATLTTTPTLTPLPIPGAMSTPIPTSTECPGGCAVAKLTAIPGMATITTVDTSPFSPLLHLSLARSGCAPFGFALIPVPHIIGTPALGSTVPLSYTWTVPLTANWDDDHPYSNTAIQPCAMVKEIPTFVWDLTYWLSVLMLAVGYTIWLIGLVGRLSGEETING